MSENQERETAYLEELVRLRARVVELEHNAELHEWGFQLFHESTIPQLLLDFETGQILMANRAAAQFYGYPVEALVGQEIAKFSAREACWTPELKARVAQNRYGIESAVYYTAQGNLREVEAHYSLVNLRGRQVIHVFLQDITDRVVMQRELEQSHERYRAFIQLASEGIWRYEATEPIPIDLPVDEQVQLMFERGYLAECNMAYARMYGYEDPAEIIGIPLSQVMVTDHPKNLAMLRTFVQNGYRIDGLESIEHDREGREHIILNSAFGIIENGHLVRAWGVQIDVTEQRRLQQELEQARRLESLGRLAGGIAHDFNNLLTAIIGYAELALLRTEDEGMKSYLEGILKASQRASNLIQQMLAYARRQVTQPRPLHPGEWLTEHLDLLQRLLPENIRLVYRAEPDIGQIYADPNQLLQVVINLVVNARDAMPDGGVLTLELLSETLNTVPHVCLKVSDTGCGIHPDDLPYIFEPFFTTKPLGKGTGLGLSAVHGIVQQMGGEIRVESELQKGTTFSVYFPRWKRERATG